MVNESYPRLLGDIGGTNARFAWQSDHAAPRTEVATAARADHASTLPALFGGGARARHRRVSRRLK